MDVWIGLISVRVQPESQILNGRKGALVNVLALASNKTSYAESVRQALTEMGLEVENIEESEPFSWRLKNSNPNQEMCHLAEMVEATKQVKIGTFHTYPDDDLNA